MFGGDAAWWINGKEIAHPHGDGVIEVRLTKAVISDLRALLKADDRVELRRSGADWVTARYASAGDVAFVAALVEAAVKNSAPTSATVRERPARLYTGNFIPL